MSDQVRKQLQKDAGFKRMRRTKPYYKDWGRLDLQLKEKGSHATDREKKTGSRHSSSNPGNGQESVMTGEPTLSKEEMA
jgi:hypothetical protein